MSEENTFSETKLGQMFCSYKGYFRRNLNDKFEEIRNHIHAKGERFRTPGGTMVIKYEDIYCLVDYPFILIAKGWGKFNFLGLDYECTDLDTADSVDMIDFMQFFSGDMEECEEGLIPEESLLCIAN